MNHEFEQYIETLMKSASANVAAGAQTNAPTAQPAAPQAAPIAPTQTPVAGNSKIANAVMNAEAQLAATNPELVQAADDLAFMEAYTATKQANYLKDQVQEAINMYPNYNPNQGAYAPQYNPYYAAPKTASYEDAAEADALYNEAYNQAMFQKTASEAQAFVDTLYYNNLDQLLPDEAQTWAALANQNAINAGYSQGY